MPKMSLDRLQAILHAERSDAQTSTESEIGSDRVRAMEYYRGEMSDMPSMPGRSSAVSSDVADIVDGIMPHLMEIFAATDEVMEFEPVGPEDEEAAQQETDYVNHVFMQKNNGWLVFHNVFKDAILLKHGIAKIFYEFEEREERETYYNLSEDAYGRLLIDPDVEIVEHTAHFGYEDYGEGDGAMGAEGVEPMSSEGGVG